MDSIRVNVVRRLYELTEGHWVKEKHLYSKDPVMLRRHQLQ